MQKLQWSHWSRPQLCASGGEWYLEGKVKTKQISHERELCVISREEPKAGVSSSGETAVKPYGETESGCTVSDVHRHWKITQLWQKMRSLPYWPIRTSPEQKTRNLCLKQSAIHAILQKEGKCSSKLPPTKSKQVHFTPKLIDLERLFFERHKQEEQGRLLALQLQKEVNQEQMRPTWIKGSPDEYQLRATSSPPGKLLNGQRKNAKERSFQRQTGLEHPAPHRASISEYWQPSFKFQLEHCAVNARKYQVLL